MKHIKITAFVLLLLAVSVSAQRKLPSLEDPAFEAVSTAYRVVYHYNRHTYTITMPDEDTPVVFQCKFGFWTSSYKTIKIGNVERNVDIR
ncbi:MAG: hypothetical protein MUP70_02540, partial [Candidatus Aminicenantes bacterium]|nr:hypothetical protein [Candidatus Aminicenantes bacterium]